MSSITNITSNTNDAPKGSFFEGLPNECILNILQHLDQPTLGRIAQVCQLFQNLRKDISLNQRDLSDNGFRGIFRLKERTIELASDTNIATVNLNKLALMFDRASKILFDSVLDKTRDRYALWQIAALPNGGDIFCFVAETPNERAISVLAIPTLQMRNLLANCGVTIALSILPNNININAVVTRGTWIRFTGSPEIDASQSAAKSNLVEWAQQRRLSGEV